MRHGHVLASCAAAALLLSIGCQQAGRYQPRSTSKENAAAKVNPTPEPPPGPSKFAPADFSWAAADPDWLEPPLPLRYVTTDSDEWGKLTEFWNVQELPVAMKPEQLAVLVGASPGNLVPLAAQVKREVKIKVPRGLDDPGTYTPASNPPTAGKWQLGKELFFDKNSFLQSSDSETKLSCASCHQPQHAFGSDQRPATVTGFQTPRLLNSAFATQYFWDGRASQLEEAVQQSIPAKADTDNALSESPHRWPGAVARLRDDVHYLNRFRKVFGTEPTQDAVAKALATYLRTLLSGNSVQDRAEHALHRRDGKTLEVQDYEKALTEDDVKKLAPEDGMKKEDVARQLHEGRGLFFGKANCFACHGGSSYTDKRFHNLGIRESDIDVLLLGRETGRFTTLPVGLKERRAIGAFKTPSLRNLLPRGPFTHAGMLPFPQDAKLQGKLDALFEVITYHTKNYKENAYLDPLMHKIELKEAEVLALALYLKSLEGEALPARVAVADELPEKLPLPKK